MKAGHLKMCKCEGKNYERKNCEGENYEGKNYERKNYEGEKCEALWIRGGEQSVTGYSIISGELMGDCDCGKILCIKHCTYFIDNYGNDRFLCEACFANREKRIEENRIKYLFPEKEK